MAKSNIRRTFLSGLLLILPLWLSLGLAIFIIKKLTSLVSPWISHLFSRLDIVISPPFLYLLSLFVVLFLIYLIGLLGRRAAGRAIVESLDRLFLKIPILKTVYSSTQKIIKAFSGDRKKTFQKVVMVEYPRKGINTVAFVTNQIGPYVSLFIPTTPNPTSGWLVLVKEDECENLDLTPDEALKLIISGGILVPEHLDRELKEKE